MPSLLLLSSGVYPLRKNFPKSYKIHDFGHFPGLHLTGVFVRGEGAPDRVLPARDQLFPLG
jgi:hypothetical protein